MLGVLAYDCVQWAWVLLLPFWLSGYGVGYWLGSKKRKERKRTRNNNVKGR